MQRWSLMLAAYQYEIEYRKSAEHANADALSRLVQASLEEQEEEKEVYLISYLEELPVTARDIGATTRKDPVLARVYDFTLHGWPQALDDPVLQPFFSRKQELSVDRGCVLWVYVWLFLRSIVFVCWITCTKSITESAGWSRWRGVIFGGRDWMLLLLKGFSNVMLMFVLPWTSPLQGHYYTLRNGLVSHGSVSTLISLRRASWISWLLLMPIPSGWRWPPWVPWASLKTIEVLRSLFARYGIPEEVVSDNGPQLASEEFSQFLKQNAVKFTRVPPFHPASNEAAERSVQTAKTFLTKQMLEGKANWLSLKHRLANFLIFNRSTPHTVDGQSPAELFLGRQIRNCFTLPKPNLNRAVEEQQLKQKEHHDEGRVKLREFKLNEVVLVRNWRNGVERWIPGRITQMKGPCTYLVRCEHQIRFCSCGSFEEWSLDPVFKLLRGRGR